MKYINIQQKFTFGLLFTVLFFIGVEVTLRIVGIAEGQQYAPPRLIKVINDGKLEGEYIQSSVPFFQKKDGYIVTNPQYASGNGAGFPASGAMRQLRFAPTPTKPRYFVLGGSAALGQQGVDIKVSINWPTEKLGQGVSVLPEKLSLSGRIRSSLSQQKGIETEVLNAGMIAQDSGGVRRIAMEVLQYKPTGLILYLGNNEGIGMAFGMQGEQLPWVPEIRDRFRFSRIYRVISDKIIPARQRFSKPPPILNGTKPTVLGQMTRTQWRAADQPLFEDGQPTDSVYLALQKRLKQNLQSIVNAANDVGTKVYIITTAPHLDYPPFYDANSPNLVEKDIQAYTQRIGQAKQFEKQKKWQDMENVLLEALSYETHHASGYYLLGTALERQKKYVQSWEARNKALLLDISRKRSLPVYADIAQSVCQEDSCITKSLYPYFQKEASRQGMNVFRQLYGDHEHLNPKGIDVVSREFVKMMTEK
jgi:hypothetical protein